MARTQTEVAVSRTEDAIDPSVPIIHEESESFLTDGVALEKFMNEPVKILVFDGGREGDLDYATPGVNGNHIVIKRGVPVTVRRSVVEVLARAKTTTFGQHEFNPHSNKSLWLIPKTSHSLPFQILEDRNPMGPAWLKSIRDQR